jgi:heme o synthase
MPPTNPVLIPGSGGALSASGVQVDADAGLGERSEAAGGGSRVGGASGASGVGGTLRALVELAKPGITRLVMVTAALGAVIAPGQIVWSTLAISLIATAMVVAGANTLNMVLERDVDARMTRTRTRPLPTGRISVRGALAFGMGLSIVGLVVQSFWVSPLTGALSGVAVLSYVFIYTPLKRITPFALHVGAIPGAIPPLIGWATVTGSLNIQALVVFAILAVWQLPHFGAIAVFRQAEYQRAGLRVLSVARNEYRARWAIIRYSAWMLAVSLLPPFVGLGGWTYWAVAWVSGIVFMGWALVGLREDSGPRWARGLFFASMPYLVLLLGTLAVTAG